MLSNTFKTSNKLMKAFLLAPLKLFFWSILIGIGMFVILAIVAFKGDWVIGTSFDTWYASLTGVAVPVDGKFSAIDFQGCWSCNLFAKTFDLMSVVGLELFVFISDIVWTLVTMGFAVWLVIYVINNVIKEQKGDIPTFGLDVIKKIFIIGIIGVAINIASADNLKKSADMMLRYTALPILEMGVGVGTEIIKSPICDKLYYPQTEVDGILSPDLKNSLLCLVNSVNVVYLSATTAGANMVSFSLKNFLNNPGAIVDVIGGMAITVIFFLMYISIPFVLIDIIFTIGILISLMPVMIGGYAYEETKKFAIKGFTSLFGMAFHIIMYCIFLGIIYSSFIFIGDMYYPAPLDNFTYLFPDFIYQDMISSQTSTIMKNEGFSLCFNQANGDIGVIQSCLLELGIEFEMPSIGGSGGSFLPIFSLGLLSLMIMGSLKSYTGIVSGYMFTIGGEIKNLITSSYKWAKSATREAVGTVKGNSIDRLQRLSGNKKEGE